MTFDQSLYDLYQEGAISLEEALNHADSRNNLALRIRLDSGVKSSGSAIGLQQSEATG